MAINLFNYYLYASRVGVEQLKKNLGIEPAVGSDISGFKIFLNANFSITSFRLERPSKSADNFSWEFSSLWHLGS